ncbi:MAG: GAF domain-containing SpoIIE family protein phosphatase [bacterium]
MIYKFEQKYKEFIKNELNSTILFLVTIVIVVVKIAGDFIFFTLSDVYSDFAISWRIVLSIALIISLILLFIKNYMDSSDDIEQTSTITYFKEITRIIYLTLGMLILNYFLPEEIKNYGPVPNLWSLLYIEIVSIFSTITGLIAFSFLLKWLWFRKHKRTKLYLKILIYSLFILIILEAPFHYYHISTEELAGNSLLILISLLIVISILLVIFLTTKKNNWIAILPKRKKLKLFVLYFIGIILSIIFMFSSMESDGEGKFSMAVQFTFGTDTLLFLSYYCLIPYFLKLMFSTIAALPTTSLVERTTTELSSLTYLNRVVAKTMDFDKLIDTLTELAIQTCRGIGSWTEIYLPNGEIQIASTQYLSGDNIKSLDLNNNLHVYLQTLKRAELVQSVEEHKVYALLNWKALPLTKSIITVPLFAGEERVGTLLVLHPEEYGLEEDDLRIMEAFGDNINLALENAKLIKDSLEKEKYRRELVLAREMEEKLLPNKLPEIPGYSLAAFTIPAKEVGGDYYDIVKIKNGKNCILIGDVSGKGMSSAFYMAQLKGVVLALAPESTGASDLLCRINQTFIGKIEKQMYITLSAFVIDDESGTVTFARAGHMPLLIKRFIHSDNPETGKNEIVLLRPNGIGISLANKKIFDKWLEEITLKLESGDICVLFTDGINELRNELNEEFGYDSLKQILKKSVYNIRAEDLVKDLKESVLKYLGVLSAHDDMTIVAIVREK